MKTNEEIINRKIKEFCYLCSNNDLGECEFPTLQQMHITDIQYDIDTNTYHIELCRPGILIGRAGKTVDKMQEVLQAKISLKEKIFYKIIL